MLFCSVRIHCWCKLIMVGRKTVFAPEYTCIFLLSLCPGKTAGSSEISQKSGSLSTLKTKKGEVKNKINTKSQLNLYEIPHLSSQSNQHWMAFHIEGDQQVKEYLSDPLLNPYSTQCERVRQFNQSLPARKTFEITFKPYLFSRGSASQ